LGSGLIDHRFGREFGPSFPLGITVAHHRLGLSAVKTGRSNPRENLAQPGRWLARGRKEQSFLGGSQQWGSPTHRWLRALALEDLKPTKDVPIEYQVEVVKGARPNSVRMR
jgi:hypothetical protein